MTATTVFAPASPDWTDEQIKARIEALNRLDAAWRDFQRLEQEEAEDSL